MLTRLLVPLDGSTFAEQALPTAVSLVKERHGRLELVLVHEPHPYHGLDDTPWSSARRSMQDSYITDKAQQLSDACGLAVAHTLVAGDVAEEVCRRARESEADLIVMTTHGRTGLSRAWLGSVAEAVVRRATTPVLLLRDMHGDPSRIPALDFRRILVPTDGSPASRRVFGIASAVARTGVSEFVLLRVVAPVPAVVDTTFPYGYISSPVDQESTQALIADAARELTEPAIELAERSACDVDPRVAASDHPATAIVEFANRHRVDLIAMTTRGLGVSRSPVGGVAERILRSSTLPLLLTTPALR
ncbi:MAG TPA: universal stress protein [Gemmatimonadaceae bacterium]|nr:universal stress protein [Gemmatimonadaceae bacterium]